MLRGWLKPKIQTFVGVAHAGLHEWAVSVVLLGTGVWMLGITLLEGFSGLIKY